MTDIPDYKVAAVVKWLRSETRPGPDEDFARLLLEEAAAATEPDEVVVTERQIIAGRKAEIETQMEAMAAGCSHDTMTTNRITAIYRAMHAAAPKAAQSVVEVSDKALKCAVEVFRSQVPGRGYEADLRDALTAALPYLTCHKCRPLPVKYRRKSAWQPFGRGAFLECENERKGERRGTATNAEIEEAASISVAAWKPRHYSRDRRKAQP